ncbi:hypothetical protein [Comamonas aquatica]|nr:hypothetical protein [Comamonas aquatica]
MSMSKAPALAVEGASAVLAGVVTEFMKTSLFLSQELLTGQLLRTCFPAFLAGLRLASSHKAISIPDAVLLDARVAVFVDVTDVDVMGSR